MRITVPLILMIILFACSTQNDILTFAGDVRNSGYIDTKGKWVIEPTTKFHSKYQFSEGCAGVCIKKTKTKKQRRLISKYSWGYINHRGRFIIRPKFEDVLPFSEGYAAVKKGNKWGYINRNGKLMIDHKFDAAFHFDRGYASVKADSLWGYIDKKGIFIINPISESSIFFENDSSLSVYERKGKVGFIDINGKIRIEPKYVYSSGFSDGLAEVSNSRQSVFINLKGDTIINDSFVHSFGFCNGFAAVEMEGRIWKYIDKKGNDVFNKRWSHADNFRDGFAIVMIDDKYGAIDTTGKVIIEIQYPFLSHIRDGFFSIGTLSDSIINSKGEIIWRKATN